MQESNENSIVEKFLSNYNYGEQIFIFRRIKDYMSKGIDLNTLIFDLALEKSVLNVSQIKESVQILIDKKLISETLQIVNNDEIRILKIL